VTKSSGQFGRFIVFISSGRQIALVRFFCAEVMNSKLRHFVLKVWRDGSRR